MSPEKRTDPNAEDDDVMEVIEGLRNQSDTASSHVADAIESYLFADYGDDVISDRERAIEALKDLIESASGALKQLRGA